MIDIVITTPKLADVDTLWQLGHNAYELMPSKRSEWHTQKDLRQWIKHPGKDILLVAKDNNVVVGFCFTSALVGWALCHDLYVIESYRRQGAGKQLVDATIEKLKQKGIGYLGLLVNVDNVVGQKFYEKNGFEKGFTFQWMSKRFRPKRK